MTSEASSNNFPHAVLTPLRDQRPTVSSLRLLQKQINANAVSVPSARGNGVLGHYALVVSPATYQNASNGIPFIPQVNPGAAPVHPNNATAAQINFHWQYLADQKEFNIYMSTKAGLKKQVLEAVPLIYINAVEDEDLGFANVSTLQLIQHLNDTYGTITADDMQQNVNNMNSEWSPSTSIEVLFEQIRVARRFALLIDPISEATAVRSALMNLEKSGVFGDAIRDWRKRIIETQTLNNLMIDF
jgi:hypothetical protein